MVESCIIINMVPLQFSYNYILCLHYNTYETLENPRILDTITLVHHVSRLVRPPLGLDFRGIRCGGLRVLDFGLSVGTCFIRKGFGGTIIGTVQGT